MLKMLLNIDNKPAPVHPFALFQLGFRPFFLGAALYSVIAILLWTVAYSFQWSPETILQLGNSFWWHGHEMVFGYATAVAAGFLLTATMNWTGVQTIRFTPLAILFSLWLLARLLPWISAIPMFIPAVLDLLFLLALTVAVTHPLYKARQWDQVRIFTSKLSTLFLCNLIFYLGIFGIIDGGERIGLYGGVYMILALILTLGRRVFPFFIEKGVEAQTRSEGSGRPLTLKNSKFLDISSLVLFLLFALSDLFLSQLWVSGALAATLVVVHGIRFRNWYTPMIWDKPLLWVLMVGYGWIIIGLLFKALAAIGMVPQHIALHAFTYGAIGIITIGMMARVSLGHSGRDILHPPRILHLIFGLLLAGAVIRVIIPLLIPQQFATLVLVSQLLWIASFSLFLRDYALMLIRPRKDGRPG